ncbi:SMI1/KNR4 family protein [Hamadaea sp. NPDC050747]|uniref:SMI1/KNR4 family protein n=1 Tax=Hamadaea sp. NPDC050747 TaxID=3155789 RepID=UPI0033E1EEA1
MVRFEQVKETFWSDSTVGVRLPLTDEMVVDAEGILGVRLPSALLELLLVQNGGCVADAWSSFPTTQPTSWSDSHVPFDTLVGIGTAEGTLSLLDTPYLVQEWGLPSPLVLLTGDGHWWIALDYRGCGPDGEPSVTWFDTELDQEQHLAADFRTFVEGLTREPGEGAAQ